MLPKALMDVGSVSISDRRGFLDETCISCLLASLSPALAVECKNSKTLFQKQPTCSTMNNSNNKKKREEWHWRNTRSRETKFNKYIKSLPVLHLGHIKFYRKKLLQLRKWDEKQLEMRPNFCLNIWNRASSYYRLSTSLIRADVEANVSQVLSNS